MLIDLQLHSTYSDGYLTPTQIANFLAKNKIKIAALTDHNTVSGLEEFKQACQKNKIKAINGLELYAKWGNRKFNLLWYNFDSRDADLHQILRASQTRRRQQIRNALLKLKKYGFKISEDKLLDKFNHYIPLNHLIDRISQCPENKKIIAQKIGAPEPHQDEIIRCIFKNPTFIKVRESYIALDLILKLRRQIGGQLILNHPGKHDQLDRKFIAKLQSLGLDGIEVISPHHTIGATMYAQRIARQYNLIMTGGSDFHRLEAGRVNLKSCFNYFKVDTKYLTGINKIIG